MGNASEKDCRTVDYRMNGAPVASMRESHCITEQFDLRGETP